MPAGCCMPMPTNFFANWSATAARCSQGLNTMKVVATLARLLPVMKSTPRTMNMYSTASSCLTVSRKRLNASTVRSDDAPSGSVTNPNT